VYHKIGGGGATEKFLLRVKRHWCILHGTGGLTSWYHIGTSLSNTGYRARLALVMRVYIHDWRSGQIRSRHDTTHVEQRSKAKQQHCRLGSSSFVPSSFFLSFLPWAVHSERTRDDEGGAFFKYTHTLHCRRTGCLFGRLRFCYCSVLAACSLQTVGMIAFLALGCWVW